MQLFRSSGFYLLLFSLISANALAMPQQFEVTNRSTDPYQGVVDVVLPFAPGEVTNLAQVQNLLADGQPTAVKAIKYHRRNLETSIAAVRLTTKMSLNANETKFVQLTPGSNNPPPLQIGPAITALGTQLANSIIIGAKIGSAAECYTSIFGPFEMLDQNRMNFTVRWRLRPRCGNSSTSPITATVYMRLGSGDDHARMTFLISNDTLERPVNGGITNAEVSLYIKDPVQIAFHQAQAFGGVPLTGTVAGYRKYRLVSTNDVLADGVRIPFVANIAVGTSTSAAVRSMRAAAANPANQILGVVSYEDYRRSEALGMIGVFPRPRFSNLSSARNALQPLCTSVGTYGADRFKGTILQHPFITGGQEDFSASLPVFGQQIAHSGSLCPLMPAYVGVLGEWIRPSASSYWSMQNGQERPVKLQTINGLMLWGDNVHQPSFYSGSQFQYYVARIGMTPGTSDFSRWDEEHDSVNAQAAVAFFVGSEDLLDLLRLHLRTIYWNHYNWYRFPAMVAPRGIARTGQMVLLLSSFFANEAEGNTVFDAFANKMSGIVRPFMTTQINTFGIAHVGAGGVNATGMYTQCLAGAFPEIVNPNSTNCANIYAWHLGFFIEAAAELMRTGNQAAAAQSMVSDLLDEFETYFNSNGNPATHVLLRSLSRREFGGIGEFWWAGYAAAAAMLPNHPRSADIMNRYVTNVLEPALAGAGVKNTYWRDFDNWNVFENISNQTFHTP